MRFIIPLKKRCYFASILFGKGVLKKNAPTVLQGACERCEQHKKPAKDSLFDGIIIQNDK